MSLPKQTFFIVRSWRGRRLLGEDGIRLAKIIPTVTRSVRKSSLLLWFINVKTILRPVATKIGIDLPWCNSVSEARILCVVFPYGVKSCCRRNDITTNRKLSTEKVLTFSEEGKLWRLIHKKVRECVDYVSISSLD